MIALELLVPHDTGAQPEWAFRMGGFVVNTIAAWVLVVATVWFALRETARAEAAMESEYRRSELLLTNILPAKIADRLKDPGHQIIADRYDDASILFADIAGYTKRTSDTSPTELVRFLDGLYTDLDALVEHHGLEKIKTSGDSYMVVSGVPEPRDDHLEALRASPWTCPRPSRVSSTREVVRYPPYASACQWTRGGGRSGGAQVLLRRVGRRRQRRIPDGVHRRGGADPSAARRLPAVA